MLPLREVIEGYEHDKLVETVSQNTNAYRPQGEWPLVAGASAVLTSAGAAGCESREIRWAVVETPANGAGPHQRS